MVNQTRCKLCRRYIRNNNYQRHVDACKPKRPNKIRGIDYDPNQGFTTGTRQAWNKGLTRFTDERVSQYSASLNHRIASGTPHGFATLTANQRQAIAKEGGKVGGGYRENAGHSKKFKVLDSYGKMVCLQSTYELRCSELLEQANIRWCRPRALQYDGSKNYFADFYLPEFDVYLDPKNAYKAKLDQEKIEKVREQNGVVVLVLAESDLTSDFFARLAQMVRALL